MSVRVPSISIAILKEIRVTQMSSSERRIVAGRLLDIVRMRWDVRITMNLLAISGSLRMASKNSTMLRAAARITPAGVTLRVSIGVGEIPHFSPDLDDLDNAVAPDAVLAFRKQLREVDGVMICSPEYAHGVAGSMKNALDWLVGSGEFVEMPTVVMNLSPGSVHAHAAIVETLRTMGALVVETKMPGPISGKQISEEQALAMPATAGFLRSSVSAILQAIEQKKQNVSE